MLITALKRRINNKEWMQDMFVEVVGDIVMIIVGVILTYVFKVYIMPF